MSWIDFKKKNYNFIEYMLDELNYFDFKKRYQDFIVEEKINISIGKTGHVFFVFFEKKGLNTMDVIDFLTKGLNLQRKHFGIGGLKDKFGITRQWISIYKRTLNSRGGKAELLKLLGNKAKILKYGRGDGLLKVGDNIGNLFFIRLRGKVKFSEKQKKEILNLLNLEQTKLFPNFFGLQRFGQGFQNVKLAYKYLSNQIKIKKEFERQFKLQAFSSFLFNFYLFKRIKSGNLFKILEGDIGIANEGKIIKGKQSYIFLDKKDNLIYTGPVFGTDLILPAKNSKSYSFEKQIFNKFFNDFSLEKNKVLGLYEQNHVFGIRRNGLCLAKDLRAKWQGNDLLLMFELPSGSYASVFVWWLDKKIREILT